jgi:hypothetical protein
MSCGTNDFVAQVWWNGTGRVHELPGEAPPWKELLGRRVALRVEPGAGDRCPAFEPA